MIIYLFLLFSMINYTHCSEHPYIIELQKKWDNLENSIENTKIDSLQSNTNKRTLYCIYKTKTNIIIDKPGNYYYPNRPPFLGYSALGVTVIAPYLTLQRKSAAIEKALSRGLIPTIKDKELAYLEWWRRIPFQQIVSFQCLIQKNQTIFSTLPPELIDLISLLMATTEKPLFTCT
jgi:hypothetical protein